MTTSDGLSGVRTASGKGSRGSYAKSESTRAAILDAALAVFAEGGYRSGSLREVAVRVGISEPAILHHFRSKSLLLAAVLERRDSLAQAFIPPHPADGVAAMHGLVALARYNASEPGVVELYCTLSAEATTSRHPAHAYFVRRYEVTRDALLEAFTNLSEGGDLRPGTTPELAARSTIAVMDGLQVQWLLDRTSVDMAEDLRAHLRLLTTVDV